MQVFAQAQRFDGRSGRHAALWAVAVLVASLGTCALTAAILVRGAAAAEAMLLVASTVFTALVAAGGLVTTRKLRGAHRAQSERERHARLALDAAELGTWRRDTDTSLIELDARAQSIMGLPSPVHAADFRRRIHPDDLTRIQDALAAALDPAHGDGRYAAEYRIVLANGEQRWVYAWARARFEDEGSTRRKGVLVGTVSDITERKRIADALAVSEERLRLAFGAANDGVWDWDFATDVVYYSPRWKAMLGYQDAELANVFDTWGHLIHPDDREPALRLVIALVEGARAQFETEVRMRHKDGHYVMCSSRAVIKRDANGVPERLVGVHVDVSETHATHRALEQHKARLEQRVSARTAELRQQTHYLTALIDNVPLGVWLKDARGRFRVINRQHAETYGVPVDEIIGKTDFDLVAHDIALSRVQSDQYVISERRACVWERTFTGGGRVGCFESYKAPVLDSDGTVIGVVGYARDISATKANEMAREAALKEAERLAEVRSAFLANMSHEIRTPLNAVLGFAQVGLRESAGRKSGATFQHILDAGHLLLGIVNEILDFSKIEAGKAEAERVAFCIGDAIDRALNAVAGQAHAKGLELIVEEAPDLPARCVGDPLRVSQALVNLLSNAVKFTAAGRVTLSVAVEAQTLRLCVSDTGIGMTPEQLERLYRPFEQADGSTTRRFGGSGLGLAITRRWVELMGGDIQARSEAGRGSTFTVRLPLIDAVQAARPERARIALLGVQAAEADRLAASLAGAGIDVEVIDTVDADTERADLVIVDPLRLDASALERCRDARVSAGMFVQLAAPATAIATPLESDAQGKTLYRPLRARHVVALLAERRRPAYGSAPASIRLAGLRILAADDVEVNRLVLESMLQAEGARMTVVDGGKAVIEQLRRNGADAYDALLLDIQMPEMDGYQTARAALEIAPQLPIIGVTAHAMQETRARCLAAGMLEHVAKPIARDVLVEAIRVHASQRGATAPRGDVVARTVSSGAHEQPNPRAAIDWPAFEARYRTHPQLGDKLIASVYTSHCGTAARVREAASCRDFEALSIFAHSLKGMAGNMAAPRLQADAVELEAALKRGDAQVQPSIDRMIDSLEEFVAALVRRRRSA